MANAPLVAVLEDGRDRGFLGPGPVEAHVDHAVTLARLIGRPDGPFLDLGSGGGVPGLVLAFEWPGVSGTLLDASQRRCEFLTEAVAELGLGGRVGVRCGRAERLARDPALRGTFPLVVARAFGPPPVVAECGLGFLADGGALVVSEPPSSEDTATAERWSETGLQLLGLSAPEARRVGAVGVVVVTRVGPVEERWPRRDGVPSKRPLW